MCANSLSGAAPCQCTTLHGISTTSPALSDPSGFKPLASAELLGEPKQGAEGITARVGGSTQNRAPIALSQGKLLIRDQNRMMCVKVAE